jgi:hypothetical protein
MPLIADPCLPFVANRTRPVNDGACKNDVWKSLGCFTSTTPFFNDNTLSFNSLRAKMMMHAYEGDNFGRSNCYGRMPVTDARILLASSSDF